VRPIYCMWVWVFSCTRVFERRGGEEGGVIGCMYCTQSCIHRDRHLIHDTYTYIHTYTHTYMHTYIHTCIHTYIRTTHVCIQQTCARALTLSLSYADANMHTRTHAYTRTYTHAHTHTHTHAHTLTHTHLGNHWKCNMSRRQHRSH